MTAIDYDTEFLEDGHTIRLISIGLIRDDGTWYYAVADDPDLITVAFTMPWLVDHVLPSLPISLREGGLAGYGRIWRWDGTHRDYTAIKPRKQIAAEVAEFITSTPDVELWADYGAYDHVALAQLFGTMGCLPDGVPMWTNDLRTEWRRLGRPALPSLPAIDEHNALDDARECQYRRRWLAKHAADLAAERDQRIYAGSASGRGGGGGSSAFACGRVTVAAPGGNGGTGGSAGGCGGGGGAGGGPFTFTGGGSSSRSVGGGEYAAEPDCGV